MSMLIICQIWLFMITSHLFHNSDETFWTGFLSYIMIIVPTFYCFMQVSIIMNPKEETSSHDSSTYMSIIISLFFYLGLRYIMYKYFITYVFMVQSVYLLISNVWIFNILINLLCRMRMAFNTLTMSLFSFILLIYPYLQVIDENFVDPFNIEFYVRFIIYQTIQILVLTMQKYYGSRFFLPNKCRARKYDKFTKALDIISIVRDSNDISCDL